MENSALAVSGIEVGTEYQQALALHREIMASGQLAADAFVEFCKGLKTMRDKKLYRELGYEDFDTYTVKAVGLKQRQAYNYISTLEKFGTQFLQSNANLGITKLELLASVPMVERDNVAAEIDGMSVAEVKELVAKYNAAQDQLSMFQKSATEEKEADDEARNGLISKIRELEEELAQAQRNRDADNDLIAEIKRLKEQLSETENDLEATQKMMEQAETSEETVKKIRAEEAAKAEQSARELVAAAEKKAKEDLKAALLKASEKTQKKIEAAEQNARQEVANAERRAQEIARQQVEDSLRNIEQEKADALARASELEKKLKVAANPDTLQLDFYLKALQENFAKVSDCIVRIACADPEAAEKFRGAVKRLLDSLRGEIGGAE